jgi:hypothetical protein
MNLACGEELLCTPQVRHAIHGTVNGLLENQCHTPRFSRPQPPQGLEIES